MKKIAHISIISLLTLGIMMAQISKEGTPPSYLYPLDIDIHTITLPEVDADALLTEDANADKNTPLRFGYEILLDLGFDNSGSWEVLSNGDKVWRLRIESNGAFSLNPLFDNFRLPHRSEFYVYSDDYTTILGAFTEDNNKIDGKFSTIPVAGEAITLEYFEPAQVTGAVINIKSVIHGYRNIMSPEQNENDRSQWCENNVSCPEGEPWEVESRSVAKLVLGAYLCSGALINNAAEDTTQYLLTAYHCIEGSGSPSYFTFMFNFQASLCYGNWGPTNQTVQGSIVRATSNDIYYSPDFALLELTEQIPTDYNVYYSGWTRSTDYPLNPVGIHHPDGDIKKISFDYDSASHYNTNKWNVIWDDGVTEPGSSGSPLFDYNHRIVGMLSTGCSDCSDQYCPDQYGKVYRAWYFGSDPSTRLSDWLDPYDTDVEFIDGLDPINPSGVFVGDLNEDEIINVQDIIIVINIIMGNLDPNEHQEIAGDMDQNGIIDILDIVQLVNVILNGSLSKSNQINSADLMINDQKLELLSFGDAAGIQLTVSGDFEITTSLLPANWEFHHNANTILIFNIDGSSITNTELFEFEGEMTIESSIIADWHGNSVEAEVTTYNPLPTAYCLQSPYPNPFNPVTRISYQLPEDGFVNITVFNLNGNLVTNLVDDYEMAGFRTINWDASDLSSGVYFIKMQTGDFVSNQKVILLK